MEAVVHVPTTFPIRCRISHAKNNHDVKFLCPGISTSQIPGYVQWVGWGDFDISQYLNDTLPKQLSCFIDNLKYLSCRWGELLRKMQLWVEILEINDQGMYAPVELHIQKDNQTGGVFQLRQGHSRRVVVRVQPVPKAGSLPVVCDIISAVYIGSVCMRTKNQQPLDSYQEKDLAM